MGGGRFAFVFDSTAIGETEEPNDNCNSFFDFFDVILQKFAVAFADIRKFLNNIFR